jgi:hypothetical protein
MCNNRADGFGEVAPALECRPNGRKPNEEFQMRNTTFISSVVLSVACVSAANAGVIPGFVSIDSFGIADGITPISTGSGYKYSSGSAYYGQATPTPYGAATSRDLIGNSRSATIGGYSRGSIFVGTNAMTMSYDGGVTTQGKWWNQTAITTAPVSGAYYSSQTSIAEWGAFNTDTELPFQGVINMSGFTAFSFDLSGYSTTGSNNIAKMYLNVLDSNYVLGSYEVALSNGHVDVAASNFGAVDWSSISQIEMVFTNSVIVSSGTVQTPPTGTVTVSNFGYVPAPGAIALLGAAGLIGARRRRD